MEMKEAYSMEELKMMAKSKGLDMAEDMLVEVLNLVADWAVAAAKKSASPYDDIVALVMPQIKEFALSQIDKIDGEDDPEY